MKNLARKEPALKEILEDPITGLIMESYEVRQEDLRSLLRVAAEDIERYRKSGSPAN